MRAKRMITREARTVQARQNNEAPHSGTENLKNDDSIQGTEPSISTQSLATETGVR